MFESVATWIVRKALTGNRYGALFGHSGVSVDTSYKALAAEAYMTNSDVFGGINAIAQAVAGISWVLYRKRGPTREDWAPVEMHQLLDLLLQPSPVQTWENFVTALVTHLSLAGRYYVHTPKAAGIPSELRPLRPDWVTVIAERDEVARYEYDPEPKRRQRAQILKLDEVMADWYFHPIDLYGGFAPIAAAAYEIEQGNHARRWDVALLKNGAHPEGIIELDSGGGQAAAAQMTQLRTALSQHTGAEGAGRTAVLSGGVKWHPMGFSPAEMEWQGALTFSTRKICQVLGVPPEIIGDHENATYSNYQEARKSFYMECVLPLMDRLRGRFNSWLVPQFGADLYLDYDKDDIEALQEDRDRVWARGLAAYSAGGITKNEYRQMLNLPPDPSGDSYREPITSFAVPADVGAKSFNLATDGARAVYWKGFDRRRGPLIAAAEHIAADVFDEERTAIEDGLRGLAPDSAVSAAIAVIDARAPEWEAMYRRIYVTASRPFFDLVNGALKAGRAVPETKVVAEDLWASAVTDYLSLTAGAKITGVLDTTRYMVRAALDAGVTAGEGIPALSARLSALYSGFGPARAAMIARTEVIAASNFGSQTGAQATGLSLRKRWLSTRGDGRTRETHAEADGQVTELQEPYIVGSSRMMFPGDTSLGADAGETIQCRCTETYEVIA